MLLYEETPFHPERLLENLIAILHPELGVEAKHEYFKPLEADN
jgi:iron complex transport system substrate-binding protein